MQFRHCLYLVIRGRYRIRVSFMFNIMTNQIIQNLKGCRPANAIKLFMNSKFRKRFAGIRGNLNILNKSN